MSDIHTYTASSRLPEWAGSERCYVLVFPDGREYDNGDGTVHYRDQQTARDAAAVLGGADVLPTPKLLDKPCVTVSCEGCGYSFDEDEVWISHFVSLKEALTAVGDAGWTVRGDKAWCLECLAPEAGRMDFASAMTTHKSHHPWEATS